MIIIYVLLNIFLAVAIAILVRYWLQTSSEDLSILKNGFRESLKKCGLTTSRPAYPIELYIWVTSHDKHVCEDCLRRSQLKPMDIADWMKLGLPGTPEAGTCCGRRCRCRLELYKTTGSYRV